MVKEDKSEVSWCEVAGDSVRLWDHAAERFILRVTASHKARIRREDKEDLGHGCCCCCWLAHL